MIKFNREILKTHHHSTSNFLMLSRTYPEWNLSFNDYFDFCLVRKNEPLPLEADTKNPLEILYRDYWHHGDKFKFGRGEFLNFCLCDLFLMKKYKDEILAQK